MFDLQIHPFFKILYKFKAHRSKHKILNVTDDY